MPIKRFLSDDRFAPEDVEVLNSAFAKALSCLGLVDRNDPIAELVARRVIDIQTSGVRDPAIIANMAVEQLTR
ncbi:hypothetical protein [Bradyrhizobium vignae]|uniref:Uncharacterized protein n=1 Tax=Bradyrhizobium vignae TaxID=1549949 RepID=A0ABS3ZT69_9BRAD|nr:hypothetical protein [Bradyrhizobium vignae]MBP0111338.1 hypothetical protein [Bradyrhizobium vignae]